MSSKFEKRLAALEQKLAEIEAHERSANSPDAKISWAGGAPGMIDLFLKMPKRMSQTEDNDLRLKYLVVMWLAEARFFHLLKADPGIRRTLDEGKVLEFVGVAKRFAPKFKELGAWYRAHGSTDGKPDRAKLKEMGCPIFV